MPTMKDLAEKYLELMLKHPVAEDSYFNTLWQRYKLARDAEKAEEG